MTIQNNVLISLLKLTKIGFTSEKAVARDTNIPVHITNNILKGLCEIRLIEYENEKIELPSNQRVKLAIHGINNGIDIERVCKVLDWKEFEDFAATAFEKNNFAVKRRFRFKASGRKWEIDVLAYSEPTVVCVDCKLWRRGWGNSAIRKVAEAQAERAEVLAMVLHSLKRRVGLDWWKKATIFPIIISLFPGPVKFYNKVPVVPILQLQNFLDEFQGHITELTHFQADLRHQLRDYFKARE